jgi:hypothetical protein
MQLAFEIALGIWMGGLSLVGTVVAYFAVCHKVEKNIRQGRPWWYGIGGMATRW